MAHIMTSLFRHDSNNEPRKGEVIHSGHFMISSVADPDDEDDVVSHDRDSPEHHDQAIRLREGYDFSDVRKETQNTYQFGHRSTNQVTIDASLSRLFKCMSLAYQGGKVVSPKWKNFKGMRLSVKDKIRLNNAIWRTWHIQYIMRRRSKLSFVQFATPLDNESDCDSHSKPEAVVMEGKYWKRRIETVVAEYKKWRAFFMDKLQQSDHPGLTWVSHLSPSTTDSNVFDVLSKGGDDAVLMDFTDRLFSCLSQPFQFPNPREIAQHATNSDMMQPGLLQLQPMIEEFMDSDTLHDIFSPNRKSPSVNGAAPGLFYSESNMPTQQANSFSGMMTTQDMNTSAVQEVSLEELVQRATEQEMSIGQPDMNMPMLDAGQQDVPQMMQSPDLNLGVTDPVLGSVQGKMYGMHAPDHTVPPMMRSKQHQATPTISQVVTAHTPHHHNHGTTYEQSKVHAAMPPPQKKAPRRRSSGKSASDLAAGQASMNITLSPMTVQQPMIQAGQQPLNNNAVIDVAIVDPTRPQMGQVTNRPGQMSTQQQQSTTIPCTLPQVVLIPENNYLQPALDHKIVFTKSLNTRNIQTGSQDVIINSMNANRQLDNLSRRREFQTVFVPVSVPQSIPNQVTMSGITQAATLRHVPMDAMPVSGVSVIGKQPQPVMHQGLLGQQQTTLLTQLLTQERHAAPSRTGNNLQPPPNKSLIQAKQAQMRKVQEEAANLNDFQNSVVLAAAQMANASQTQAKVVPQQQQQPPVHLPQLQNTTQSHSFVAAFNQVLQDKSSGVSVATPMDVNDPVKPFVPLRTPGSPTKRHAKEDQNSPLAKWQAVQSGSSSSAIDMDDSGFPDRMISESFASAMEATDKAQSASSQKTAHSAAGSPASSTTSGTGDLRNAPFTAEQKRRCNIKALCDRLQEILPDVNSQPNSKVSKAVLLNKSCNYIKQLQAVRQQTSMEVQQLKKKIEALNEDISNIQQQLPVTGAPVSRHRGDRMRLVFEDWVRDRTLHNWKFYIFSMIIRSWFVTYDQSVSVANLEELCKTCLLWLEKYCALPSLRRSVVNSLQELSTTTSILSDPATLQQQAETAVKQNSRPSSSSSS